MRARVIVVAGPSGSGKSQLCQRLAGEAGLPVVSLDDFYKDGDDPTLPRRALAAGAPIVDWDHPDSWRPDDAVASLRTLCEEGRADVPVYDIPRNGRIGHRMVELGGAAYVLAEGIFADEIVAACRRRGLLADAVCIHNPRLVTFWRRLVRDLRESRKPPWVLVRRGVALLRAEPVVLARARAAGCVVLSNADAYRRLRALVHGDDV
ncbi:MAG TPA: ATP-binding protein [Marmoricola sp.]|nr:ATP-binding protein [Marmoricola sp.]